MGENANGSNTAAVVVVILILLLGGGGGAWYWFMYKPEQEAKEKARLEQIAKEKADKKRKEELVKKKAKYDKLIEDANAEFDLENWEAANSLYLEASALFSKEQYPKDQLALISTKLEEIAALEAKIAAGIVETISSATGRYYVIVSSSIDDDLAMDYSNRLAKEGNLVKIIEPYSNKLFYRVSLGDYASWEEAELATSSFSTYDGGNAWVLKY